MPFVCAAGYGTIGAGSFIHHHRMGSEMKRILKRTGRILLIVLCAVLALLSATAIHHRLSLGYEADDIAPNGALVEVDGHKMHVYAEGEKGGKPTLVFLSGAGTVAPVYNFKSLYALLSDEYRIAVVEKAGYGYSEIRELDRDIGTMLDEVRQALSLAGEGGPYVLFAHSMSGLEAIHWAQRYPGEVAGIVGLDMAVPESYERFDGSGAGLRLSVGRASVWLGLHRIPGVYSLDTTALTEYEMEQQRLLMHRNAVNIDYALEEKAVYGNAMAVKSGGTVDLPMLMFLSDGTETGEDWIACQKRFAQRHGAQAIELDCGHYVHNHEYGAIAEKAREFLSTLEGGR